jgi:hypothetical protein
MPLVLIIMTMLFSMAGAVGILCNKTGKWWASLAFLLMVVSLSELSWAVIAGNAPYRIESVENCRITTVDDSKIEECQIARCGTSIYNVTKIMGVFYDPSVKRVLRVYHYSSTVKGIDFMHPVPCTYDVVLDSPEAQ